MCMSTKLYRYMIIIVCRKKTIVPPLRIEVKETAMPHALSAADGVSGIPVHKYPAVLLPVDAPTMSGWSPRGLHITSFQSACIM